VIPTPREQVLEALLSHFKQNLAPLFKTFSRKLKMWDQVPHEDQPAFFLTAHEEDHRRTQRGTPRNMDMMGHIYIYARIQDGEVGDQVVNKLLEAVEAAFTPDGGQQAGTTFTIDGRVYNCWIEGRVLREPGDLDGQALIMIPVNISFP